MINIMILLRTMLEISNTKISVMRSIDHTFLLILLMSVPVKLLVKNL